MDRPHAYRAKDVAPARPTRARCRGNAVLTVERRQVACAATERRRRSTPPHLSANAARAYRKSLPAGLSIASSGAQPVAEARPRGNGGHHQQRPQQNVDPGHTPAHARCATTLHRGRQLGYHVGKITTFSNLASSRRRNVVWSHNPSARMRRAAITGYRADIRRERLRRQNFGTHVDYKLTRATCLNQIRSTPARHGRIGQRYQELAARARARRVHRPADVHSRVELRLPSVVQRTSTAQADLASECLNARTTRT